MGSAGLERLLDDEFLKGFKQMVDLDGLAFFDALDQHGDGADDAIGLSIAENRIDALGIGYLGPGKFRYTLCQTVTECDPQCFPTVTIIVIDQFCIDDALQRAWQQRPLSRHGGERRCDLGSNLCTLLLHVRDECRWQRIEPYVGFVLRSRGQSNLVLVGHRRGNPEKTFTTLSPRLWIRHQWAFCDKRVPAGAPAPFRMPEGRFHPRMAWIYCCQSGSRCTWRHSSLASARTASSASASARCSRPIS